MPRNNPLQDFLDTMYDALTDAAETVLTNMAEQHVPPPGFRYGVNDPQGDPLPRRRTVRQSGKVPRPSKPPKTRPSPSKSPESTLYDVLEVSPKCSPETLSAAFRSLSTKYHPDKGGDGEKFKKISAAWTVLKDGKTRREYDRKIGVK